MSQEEPVLEPVERHPFEADSGFDGGDLNCGNGLLLLIRRHIDPLEPGQLLEIRSTEISVPSAPSIDSTCTWRYWKTVCWSA